MSDQSKKEGRVIKAVGTPKIMKKDQYFEDIHRHPTEEDLGDRKRFLLTRNKNERKEAKESTPVNNREEDKKRKELENAKIKEENK